MTLDVTFKKPISTDILDDLDIEKLKEKNINFREVDKYHIEITGDFVVDCTMISLWIDTPDEEIITSSIRLINVSGFHIYR